MNLPTWHDLNPDVELDLDLLQKIENLALEQVCKLRMHERVEARVPVRLDAANRDDSVPSVKGVTQDLSPGGCRAIMRAAPHVGDIFRLEIELEKDAGQTLYARCLRCALLRDDAFDVAFQFLSELALPEADEQS
jgi:hypothetical protein